MAMKIIFCNVTLCRRLKLNRRYRETKLLIGYTGYAFSLFFIPENGGDILPRKFGWL
jgi:hypothetical protein